jgi:FG-GAP repeat protein
MCHKSTRRPMLAAAAMRTVLAAAMFIRAESPASAQTIEPGQFINIGTLTRSDGTPADGAVSIHDNIAVVGGDEIASVFQRDPDGNAWNETAVLMPSDGASGFGRSVSTTGDTVVVGAIGAAYVFRSRGQVWQEVARLTPRESRPGVIFGQSVSINGNTVVVGAPFTTVGPGGSAYVFEEVSGDQGEWRETATLSPPPSGGFAEIQAFFGSDVAIDQDTIVVGSVWRLSLPALAAPRAFVFGRDQGGHDTWGFVATLTQALAIGNIEQPVGKVGIKGDTAVLAVGGVFKSVHVYARNEGGTNAWGAIADLTPKSGKVTDFGRSAALGDGIVVVHSPLEEPANSIYYLFARNQGRAEGWEQVARLIQPNRAPPGHGSIAANGDTIMFDAPLEIYASDIDHDGTRDGADLCPRDPLNNVAGGCQRASQVHSVLTN